MKKNLFDKIVEIVSPERALNRVHARAKLEVVEKHFDKVLSKQERQYDGAAKGRHYSDWYSPDQSANREVVSQLNILRNRSRDLARNNVWAISGNRVLKTNIVGTGIIPTFKGAGLGKKQLQGLKDMWQNWAGKTECDYDDMNTFYGLQSLIMKTVIESGEAVIRRIRIDSNELLPLRLQVLEGDMIDSTKHSDIWDRDGTKNFYGVKINKQGRRLGYWLYRGHPSEVGAESDLIDAKDIIHFYEVERPGQMRGVPLSCGAMTTLKDLGDYEFTERQRAKIAAAFAVFVTSDLPSDVEVPESSCDEYERIEPGTIKELNPGQSISVAEPPTTQGYGEYVKTNLRGVSAGFGTSYESLTNDYSNVNFSSGRMGWIESNRNVEHFQWLVMIPRFCDKVYSWFVEACQLKGIIPFNATITATWTPPRREMIDPYKEIQGLKEGLRAGLYSWQDVVRMQGYIPDELMEELKQDKEMWDKLGLMPTIDPRYDSNRPPGEVDPELMKDEKP